MLLPIRRFPAWGTLPHHLTKRWSNLMALYLLASTSLHMRVPGTQLKVIQIRHLLIIETIAKSDLSTTGCKSIASGKFFRRYYTGLTTGTASETVSGAVSLRNGMYGAGLAAALWLLTM